MEKEALKKKGHLKILLLFLPKEELASRRMKAVKATIMELLVVLKEITVQQLKVGKILHLKKLKRLNTDVISSKYKQKAQKRDRTNG
mmetsp:Transcript_42078/g.64509  ORF Transcript_42078/g.64509 Transcript_42078/m.64509 type:complete len:87 (+) Transcript_42078:1275-1535(+)